MLRRYLSSSLLTAMLLCFMASGIMATNAQAQERRPGGLYIRARVGANSYAGDRDFNPDNEFGDFFGSDDCETFSGGGEDCDGGNYSEDRSQIDFPSFGLDLGYNAKFGVINGGFALTYTGGKYTDLINANFRTQTSTIRLNPDDPLYLVDQEESSLWRHTVGLMGRIGFAGGSVVQPYVNVGGQTSFAHKLVPVGHDEDETDYEFTFGPMAGIGFDIAITERIGFFLEGMGYMLFPDDNIDLSAGVDEDEHEDFDLLGFYGGGLRLSFGSVFTPVEIVSLDCPAELEVGEAGTFTATINEGEATTPITSRWRFGDGTTETRMVATKTFNSPGTYTVTYMASNDGATAEESCVVEVEEPPAPAIVTSIDCGPRTVEPGESVSFTSNVRGDRPIDCEWDFGDGESSSNCNPTHVYDEAGTYNVTFTASNEFGSDTASCTKVVEDRTLPAICTNVTEFNSAYFGRNSSTLSAEARETLRENLQILQQCPNLCVDVEGFASRSERDPDDLSSARADAVAEYYEDNGINADRIDADGMGARGQTTKKGGDAEFRRADSIPESCQPAGQNSDSDPRVGSDPDYDDDDMMDDMDM